MIVMAERIPVRGRNNAARPRPCMRPQNHVGIEVLPADAFPMGNGRRLGVCKECKRKERAEVKARKAKRKATFIRNGVTFRRCGQCRRTMEMLEHFHVNGRNPDGTPKGYAYICKKCTAKRVTALRHDQLQDPHLADGVRARRRAATKRWRERNREHYQQLQRDYRARVKADPVRHARKLETDRLRARLKAEQEGRVVANQRITHPAPEPQLPRLPAEPLLRAVEEHVRLNSYVLSLTEVGVDERTIRRWRDTVDAGKTPWVQFRAADKTLLAISQNHWDVWPEAEYPDLWVKIHKALAVPA